MVATPLTRGERSVSIPVGSATLQGRLAWPAHPSGIVVFVHGSGRGCESAIDAALARQLRSAGLGTLLVDLLSETEAKEPVVQMEMLTGRLREATEWMARQPEADGLALGYFGAGRGAVAALEAAARSSIPIGAVVARGPRLDLARGLEQVTAPTLLVTGVRDSAFQRLRCTKQIVRVPGTGNVAEVGQWASGWFVLHLAMERTWQAARV